MIPGKKIYFLSDFHLGSPDEKSSRERELRIVSFLQEAKKDAEEIFLVGDTFDFWFEYKRVIPKGFVRLQGKIAEITDAGIPVHMFIGNHDMWMFDYLPKEIGVKIYKEPIVREWNGKKFFIGHGDGLGPGDRGYKFLKKILRAGWARWMFARLHPNFGIWLATRFSKTSRRVTQRDEYMGDDKEFLVQFCKTELEKTHYDFFIFGHRHLALDKEIKPGSRYVNLGDWITFNTWAYFDGENFELKEWNK